MQEQKAAAEGREAGELAMKLLRAEKKATVAFIKTVWKEMPVKKDIFTFQLKSKAAKKPKACKKANGKADGEADGESDEEVDGEADEETDGDGDA